MAVTADNRTDGSWDWFGQLASTWKKNFGANYKQLLRVSFFIFSSAIFFFKNISLNTRWRSFGFFHFTFVKKNMESSVIFLRNGVLSLNWKEDKDAGSICFEIRTPRKNNKEILRKFPSKIYGSYSIMEKKQKYFLFVNISEYHHREMGLL